MHKPYEVSKINGNRSNFAYMGLSVLKAITIPKSREPNSHEERGSQLKLTVMYNKITQNKVFFNGN